MAPVVGSCDDQVVVVLPEAHRLIGAVASPVAVHRFAQRRVDPSAPYLQCAATDAVVHLVHASTSALAHVGADAHVASIAAVGSGCAGREGARHVESAYARVVRPVGGSHRECRVDAVVVGGIATVVIPIGHSSLG